MPGIETTSHRGIDLTICEAMAPYLVSSDPCISMVGIDNSWSRSHTGV